MCLEIVPPEFSFRMRPGISLGKRVGIGGL